MTDTKNGDILLRRRRKRSHPVKLVTQPLTGLPALSASPNAPVLTSKQVAELLADFRKIEVQFVLVKEAVLLLTCVIAWFRQSSCSGPESRCRVRLMKVAFPLMFGLTMLPVCSQYCRAQCKDKLKLPKFSDYSVSSYSGKVHEPILKTRHQRMFRRRIREAVNDGVNFAGHYVVASWGCGTGCLQFTVVDAVTGAVAGPPFQWIEFHYWAFLNKTPKWAHYEPNWTCFDDFLSYKPESSLLVVEGCIGKHQCGRTFYEMKEGRLRQLLFDPDLLPDGTVAPIGP